MSSPDLLTLVLGPAGTLVACLVALRTLWQELVRVRAALEAERNARREDARTTTRALLQMQSRVLTAIDLFSERPCIAKQEGFRRELPTLTDMVEAVSSPRPERPAPLVPSLNPHPEKP